MQAGIVDEVGGEFIFMGFRLVYSKLKKRL